MVLSGKAPAPHILNVTLGGAPAGSRLIQLGGYGSSTFYLTTAGDIDEFLELARDFQLRRTMAELLRILSVGPLLGSFRGKKQARSAGIAFQLACNDSVWLPWCQRAGTVTQLIWPWA